jgi:hypothetical protein
MKNLAIALLLSGMLLTGCKKEPPVDPPGQEPAKTCILERSAYQQSSFTFKFDSEGRATECHYYYGSQTHQVTTYEYINGKLSMIENYADSNKTVLTARETFAESPGKIIHTRYSYNNGQFEEENRTVYLLNADGRLSAKEYYLVTDGDEVLWYTHIYSLDMNDNIATAKGYVDGKHSYTITYTYDDKRNMNAALPTGTILLNGKNNLVKEVARNLFGEITSQQKYAYSYNTDGYPSANLMGQTFTYRYK